MGRVIAIAGNIGSGKTTLAKILSEKFGWNVQLEDVSTNPYIDNFYSDMGRWSFNMQVYYLKLRFAQIVKNNNSKNTVIQDRTIYEDRYIFAPSLNEMGLMSKKDYETYTELFQLLHSLITPPNLVIYLKSSVSKLQKQIEERSRNFEKKISSEYLQKLNVKYESWIDGYKQKHLVVDIDQYDYSNNEDDLKEVLKNISLELS